MAINTKRQTASTVGAINAELEKIQVALKDALSRKGVTPNAMEAPLDMNSNRIINLLEAIGDTEPATWGQVKDYVQDLIDSGTLDIPPIEVYSSFNAAKNTDNEDAEIVITRQYSDAPAGVGLGGGTFVKVGAGTAGDTDGGSYFVDTAGNKFELLHNGTVSIQQFGVIGSEPAGDRVQLAIDSDTVVKVVSEENNIIMDKIVAIQKSNKELDFSNVTITWTGSYDVYAQFADTPGVKLNRSVGVVTVRGSWIQGRECVTTSAPIEGESFIDVDNASWVEEGSAVLLAVTYPRRDPTYMLVNVAEVDANRIYLKYTFGWDAVSVKVLEVNCVENVTVKLNKIINKAPYPNDTNAKNVSGLGVAFARNLYLEPPIFVEGVNPALNTRYASYFQFDGGEALRPIDTGPGKGYSVQLNEGCHIKGRISGGVNTRHVLDYTGVAFAECEVGASSDSKGSSQLITHGQYEHDCVFKGVSSTGTLLNGVNIAGSGANFGGASKRIGFINCTIGGKFKSQRATDLYLEKCNLVKAASSFQEIELGCQGNLTVTDCTFDSELLVRVRPRPEENEFMGVAIFTRCVLPKDLRTTWHTGGLEVVDCRIKAISQSIPDTGTSRLPEYIKVRGGSCTMADSFRCTARASILFSEVDVKQEASNKRIVCDAKLVKAVNCVFYEGAGFHASGEYVGCLRFLLKGCDTSGTDPSATSSQFAIEHAVLTNFLIDSCYFKFSSSEPSAYGVNFRFINNLVGSVRASVVNSSISNYLEDRNDTNSIVLRFTSLNSFIDDVNLIQSIDPAYSETP